MSDRETHDSTTHHASGHEHVCVHGPERPGRRSFLGAAAATLGALAAMPVGLFVDISKRSLATSAAAKARIAKAGDPPKTRLVLLGVAGGPPPVRHVAGIATALVVNDGVYLIDCGRGAVSQFMNAGLNLSKIKGVFISHLHLDHVIDLFDFFALGVAQPNLAKVDGISQPVPVFGPGRAPASVLRRQLPNFIGGDNPVPGTADLMSGIPAAMARQLNQYKINNSPDVRDLIDVREIPVPAGVPATTAYPPPLPPFPLFENDDVKVSATIVPHVYSSFAFRFDTEDGSFVFSGDTGKSEGLMRLAKDADVLVHEAIDLDATVKHLGVAPEFAGQLKQGHTDILDVASIAQGAGAKTLVLNHLTPAEPEFVSEKIWRTKAKKGYGGNVIVGRDLMQLTAAGKQVRG